MKTEITKEEYMRRFSNRIMEVAGIDESLAMEVAESSWDHCIDHSDPEDDADEELYYWAN